MEEENRFRNVWCCKYSDCLDGAVAADQNFDCSGCSYRNDETGKATLQGIFREALLFIAILYPDAYRSLKCLGSDISFHLLLRHESAVSFVRKIHGVLKGYDAGWEDDYFPDK